MRPIPVLAGAALLAGCATGPAGDDESPTATADPTPQITLTSSAFADGEAIPDRFTCFGDGEVLPLEWTGVPAAAESLALTVRDPDAPDGDFVHWVVYDVPPDTTTIPDLPAGTKQGTNSAGLVGWVPPCPPSGTHRYNIVVFALESPVESVLTADILAEIDRLAVASGTLTGLVTSQFPPEPTGTPTGTAEPTGAPGSTEPPDDTSTGG